MAQGKVRGRNYSVQVERWQMSVSGGRLGKLINREQPVDDFQYYHYYRKHSSLTAFEHPRCRPTLYTSITTSSRPFVQPCCFLDPALVAHPFVLPSIISILPRIHPLYSSFSPPSPFHPYSLRSDWIFDAGKREKLYQPTIRPIKFSPTCSRARKFEIYAIHRVSSNGDLSITTVHLERSICQRHRRR